MRSGTKHKNSATVLTCGHLFAMAGSRYQNIPVNKAPSVLFYFPCLVKVFGIISSFGHDQAEKLFSIALIFACSITLVLLELKTKTTANLITYQPH